MSIEVTCYNGHKLTALEEHYGTKAKCPVCGGTVAVPRPSKLSHLPAPAAGETPPPLVIPTGEMLADDDPPLTAYPGLRKVRQGLGYHYARVVIYLTTIFVLSVSVAFGSMATSFPALEEIWGVGLVLTVILLYMQPVLGLVGSILCLEVPPESSAKNFIIANVVLDLTAIPIGTVLRMADRGLLWAAPLGFTAWVLFMLFLRRLAAFLNRPVEESSAREILTDGLLLLVPPTLIVLLTLIRQLTDIQWLYFLIAVALFFAWLVQGIKFLFSLLDLIAGVREAIHRRMPETAR
jgi:hypothetical protein